LAIFHFILPLETAVGLAPTGSGHSPADVLPPLAE